MIQYLYVHVIFRKKRDHPSFSVAHFTPHPEKFSKGILSFYFLNFWGQVRAISFAALFSNKK